MKKKNKWGQLLKADFRKNWLIYLMLVPVIVYLLIFCYAPMYGIVIAFKDFKPRLGIMGSDWVGLKYFKEFVGSVFFGRTFKNTLMLSGLNLLFGFCAPIVFAILLNEVRNLRFKKVVQTVTYLPHFITTVIIASLILIFTDSDGFITQIVNSIIGHEGSLIGDKHMFRPIYVISDIWQSFGWGSIVYLAAIMGIDTSIYEAARIDGANVFQRIFKVTIPMIMPTTIILLLLSVGGIFKGNFDMFYNLVGSNGLLYNYTDVIDTLTFRALISSNDFGMSAAVGLYQSVLCFITVVIVNKLVGLYDKDYTLF